MSQFTFAFPRTNSHPIQQGLQLQIYRQSSTDSYHKKQTQNGNFWRILLIHLKSLKSLQPVKPLDLSQVQPEFEGQESCTAGSSMTNLSVL